MARTRMILALTAVLALAGALSARADDGSSFYDVHLADGRTLSANEVVLTREYALLKGSNGSLMIPRATVLRVSRPGAPAPAKRRPSVPKDPEKALLALEDLADSAVEEVAMALTKERNPRLVGRIVPHLGSGRSVVRAQAAMLLGIHGDAGEAWRLHRLLRDRDAGVRRMALRSLRTLGSRESFTEIEPLCRDRDPLVRRVAIGALIHLAKRHGLLERLEGTFEQALRFASVEALPDALDAVGLVESKQLWPLVTPHLGHRSARVRAAAVDAIAKLEVPEATRDLIAAMWMERDRTVRIRMARAAGRLKAMGAVEPLISWLEDRHPDNVRAAARKALVGLTGRNLGTDAARWTEWWSRAGR